MRTEDLIQQMAEGASPVRRLPSPSALAAVFLAAAALVMAVVTALFGLRPNLAAQLRDGAVLLPWLASILTGVLAILAAAHLAVPDRSARWRWVPLPAAFLWFATLGGGCVAEWWRTGQVTLVPGLDCLPEILAISLPLTVLLLLLLRHAAALRPLPTAFFGALAVAALASAAMELFHAPGSALTVLVWHGGTVALLGFSFLAGSRWVFRLIGARAAIAR